MTRVRYRPGVMILIATILVAIISLGAGGADPGVGTTGTLVDCAQ